MRTKRLQESVAVVLGYREFLNREVRILKTIQSKNYHIYFIQRAVMTNVRMKIAIIVVSVLVPEMHHSACVMSVTAAGVVKKVCFLSVLLSELKTWKNIIEFEKKVLMDGK